MSFFTQTKLNQDIQYLLREAAAVIMPDIIRNAFIDMNEQRCSTLLVALVDKQCSTIVNKFELIDL